MILLLFVSIIITGTTSFDPTKHENWKLLPHDHCGESLTMKIIGGNEAPMNGYPWMAQLLGAGINTTMHLCGGALINTESVLTAAHCVVVDREELKIKIVRFGEHDTGTNPDCLEEFCADPVVDIKPSEMIVHKNYSSVGYKNDIALIRLEEKVKFSVFIRPICFPSGELLTQNYVGFVTELAGWGVHNVEFFNTSNTLLVIKIPVREPDVCLKHLPPDLAIGPNQLCAGGNIGRDSCVGDSGGPLMKVGDGPDGPRYYILGIVSFGTKECGSEAIPSVYTRLSSYMKWVLDNLLKTGEDAIRVE